jgi:hypothetical protein
MKRLSHSVGLAATLGLLVLGCENGTNPTELSHQGGASSVSSC